MPNRLADSRSPYLRQHRDNPVDWYPWGDEAFAKAAAEGKPVLLSVGYSSCHWCHVMAHESFEDASIGNLLNEHFVNIKVDREERPDVDEAYMTAVQLSSGHGGWPMTVFMTPDKKPFFAGTYFPREDRGDHPGFRTIVTQIAKGWRESKLEFEHAAHEFASALQELLAREAPATFATLSPDLIKGAVYALHQEFDNQNGGFGGAPKFPSHSAIEFLRAYAREDDSDLSRLAVDMAQATLAMMIAGGIHDHAGGGFHRYSTDAEWRLPHFEKMLYDNALLMSNLSDFPETAQGVRDWLIREMRDERGLFYSALDADSEGEEGKFYVWTREEVESVLGGRAEAFGAAFDIRPEGNFRDEATGQATGHNVLFRMARGDWQADLAKLRNAREKRPRPGLDDKIVVGWNGLAIAGLAENGFTEEAERAASFLAQIDPLPRIVGGSDEGFLEDYAALALGCHVLFEQTGKAEWKGHADRLTLRLVDLFGDADGGFHSTSDRHEVLFGRSMPVFDNPIPSANALALRCLVRTDPEHPLVKKSFDRFVGWMERAPTACEGLLLAYFEWLRTQPKTGTEPTAEEPKEVEVTLLPQSQAPGELEVRLVVRIPSGLHINSHSPTLRWLIPTEVTVQGAQATIEYPLAEDDKYEGSAEIQVKLHGKPRADVEITIRYQACNENACLAPVEKSFVAQLG